MNNITNPPQYESLSPRKGVVPFDNISLEEQDSPKPKNNNRLGIMILMILYFIQGIPLGLFDASIPFLLIDRGVDYLDLGMLSFFSYPFAMKILFAPFEDSHFFEKFGKRKSFVIPCQYILALMFLVTGLYIEKLLNEKDVFALTMIGFLMTMMAALQDIAVDGWQLTLLDEGWLVWGSVSQSIGQTLGSLFGSSFLIQLNSVKFCNAYLYSQPNDKPILEITTFFYMVGGLILIITLLIHFLKSERNPQSSSEQMTMWQVIKSLKGFFKNKNLRFLIFHLLFWRLGFCIVNSTFSVNLIRKGLSKETLMNVITALIPLTFLVSFLSGKTNGKGLEMKIYLRLYLLKILDNVLLYLVVIFYSDSNLFMVFLGLGQALSMMIQTGMFVLYGGFANRISDLDVGGTYLTFLNSVHNLGNMVTGSVGYYLVAAFDYQTLVYISWVFAVGYYVIFRKEIERIGRISKDEWALKTK